MFQFWGRPENHIGLCQDVSRHGLYNPVAFNNSITVDSSLKMFLFLFFVLIRSLPRYVLFGGYFQCLKPIASVTCFIYIPY